MTFEKAILYLIGGKGRIKRKKWGNISIRADGEKFEIDENCFKTTLNYEDIFANDWEVVEIDKNK